MGKFKKVAVLMLSVILMTCIFISTGCKKQETPEQIVVKVAQYIADAEDEDLSDVSVISGSVKEDDSEENGYLIYCKIKVRGYLTFYFHAKYNAESNEISYSDMSRYSSVLGPGYFDKESLDIDLINQMLHNL